jgi:tripeptide aminopeptidase
MKFTHPNQAMFQSYHFTVSDRFLRYVKMDTQSDAQSKTQPSTEKQKVLGRMLVGELKELGLADAELDEFGYVYASIPANSQKNTPVICFCAHMDTAPDCSGKDVKPIVHRQFSGEDIILPDDPSQVISIKQHPYLMEKIGEDLITASGTTLLGADDKAGLAVIMDMAAFLMSHPEQKHGLIRILFTPDEEIGRGVDRVDLQKLNAEFGYTLDAGERGSLEDETFSADELMVVIHGVSAHPGYAKDKMVNALKVGAAWMDALPKDELSPESTEGRYGFVHPIHMEGIPERMVLKFIIRDFFTHKLAGYEDWLREKLESTIKKFPGSRAEFQVKEQYRNMKEVLDRYPRVTANARQAMERTGLEVKNSSARGGTDGSRLSFMGLPCPNLFTGEMAFHGKQEYVSIQDMQKSVETLVHLAGIWEEQSG